MSDVVAVALITGGLTLSGVILTQLFNFLAQGREQEERYRLALYDKRLAVHQQAFEWLMKLLDPLDRAQRPDSPQQDKEELAELCRQADAWWCANCLYLDPYSRDKLHRFIFWTDKWARGWSGEDWPDGDPVNLYRDSWRAVQRGIGMKHIDPRTLPKEFGQ